MHRLLVDTKEIFSPSPRLSADAAAHLKVIRPKENETIGIFDGRGRERVCVWKNGALAAAGDAVSVEKRRNVVLFACLVKSARWDWLVEKATEVGVDRIVPVISARTVVRLDRSERSAKSARWRKVAEESARQSGGVFVPEISPALDFREAVEEARRTECFALALTDPPSPPLLGVLEERLGNGVSGSVGFFTGPEGDFTPEELSSLLEFAKPVSLGPSVLRAETASIFALSVMSAVAIRAGFW